MKDKFIKLFESLHKKGYQFVDTGDELIKKHPESYIEGDRFGIKGYMEAFEVPTISQVGDDILEIMPVNRIIVLDVRLGNSYYYGRIKIKNKPAYLNFSKDYSFIQSNSKEEFDEKYLLTLVVILNDLYKSDEVEK